MIEDRTILYILNDFNGGTKQQVPQLEANANTWVRWSAMPVTPARCWLQKVPGFNWLPFKKCQLLSRNSHSFNQKLCKTVLVEKHESMRNKMFWLKWLNYSEEQDDSEGTGSEHYRIWRRATSQETAQSKPHPWQKQWQEPHDNLLSFYFPHTDIWLGRVMRHKNNLIAKQKSKAPINICLLAILHFFLFQHVVSHFY